MLVEYSISSRHPPQVILFATSLRRSLDGESFVESYLHAIKQKACVTPKVTQAFCYNSAALGIAERAPGFVAQIAPSLLPNET